MLISFGNLRARLERASDEEVEWVADYLAMPDAKARFRGKIGDGLVHLYDPVTRAFAAGFLPGLVKSARLDGFQVDTFDRRGPAPPDDPNADLAWLRDYQMAAVQKVIAKKRGLLHLSLIHI